MNLVDALAAGQDLSKDLNVLLDASLGDPEMDMEEAEEVLLNAAKLDE